MGKIDSQVVNLENIQNIVIDYIDNFITENNMDIEYIKPMQYNFILLNVYTHIIKPNIYILLKKDNNKLEYDYNKVEYIYNIYRYITLKYSNDINISGFCEFSGIDRQSIYNWASADRFDIHKKIMEDNETCLENMLKDTKYNPMKILPILNRRHNWNMPGVRESKAAPALISRENMQLLPDAGSAESVPNLPTIAD